jgi:alkyl hydroperoxide reductase subunit AhpF
VNLGCEETQSVKTPEVFFGTNPGNIQFRPEWLQTDNVKSHNQEVIYDKDPANHVKGAFAQGSITGLDKQLFNCLGGGHGTLALHVTWTEEQTSTDGNH